MIAGRRRLAGFVLSSESAILLVGMMFLGSLALWVGVPLGWLWIGAQIQAETRSIGVALLAMLVGILVSVAVLVSVLGWLARRHMEIQELRGREIGETTPLEQVLVGSAVVAVIGFAVWFFGFSGSAPLPGLELSY
jgi:heme/copper-type cytochrome/quinol oxidase subunit 2